MIWIGCDLISRYILSDRLFKVAQYLHHLLLGRLVTRCHCRSVCVGVAQYIIDIIGVRGHTHTRQGQGQATARPLPTPGLQWRDLEAMLDLYAWLPSF